MKTVKNQPKTEETPKPQAPYIKRVLYEYEGQTFLGKKELNKALQLHEFEKRVKEFFEHTREIKEVIEFLLSNIRALIAYTRAMRPEAFVSRKKKSE